MAHDPFALPRVPPPKPSDPEDVSWALSTAEAMWQRGDHAEAIKWVRRAAEAASEAEADDRALELAKAAAEIAGLIARSDSSTEPKAPRAPSVPPPRVPPVPPSPASAPTASRAYAPTTPGAPSARAPAIASRPPQTLTPRSAPPPALTPRPASVRPSAPPSFGPSTAAAALAATASPPGSAAQTSQFPALSGDLAGRLAPDSSSPVMSDSRTGQSFSLTTSEWPTLLTPRELPEVGPAPMKPARSGERPSARPPPAPLATSQAVRVVLWRDASGVHIAPAGTVVSAITVDALVVTLDPDTDLASWLSPVSK